MQQTDIDTFSIELLSGNGSRAFARTQKRKILFTDPLTIELFYKTVLIEYRENQSSWIDVNPAVKWFYRANQPQIENMLAAQ